MNNEINMEEMTLDSSIFPSQLESWMGNSSGGVRRIYDEKSGRQVKKLGRKSFNPIK